MKRIKFKKKELEAFYSMLSYDLFKWQKEEIWNFYKAKHNEYHLVAPRQNGKSKVLEVISLIELLFNENKITYTSHEVPACETFFNKLKFELLNNDDFAEDIARIVSTPGRQSIEMKTGAKISFKARTKDGGIGDSNDVIIFDEFQQINEKQMSAIFPTLAAMEESITLYAGTSPRTYDDDAFYRKQRKSNFGKDNWREYGIGAEYDFEYLKKNNLFLDKKILKKSNPSYGVMLSYTNIEREFGKMDELDYAIQRLGLFHEEQQKMVFTENMLNKVLIGGDEAQKFKGEFILGIKFGKEEHCAIIGTQKDGVNFLQVLDKRKNIDGFEWLANYINDNENCVGVIADGWHYDTFAPLIVFKNRYKKIGGNEFIASQNIFEQEIITAKLRIANQENIKSELQNVRWQEARGYTKFAPLNDDSEVIIPEAMAITNHHIKTRRWD